MPNNVTGTNIISQWIIEDKKARKTLSAGISLVSGFVKKASSSFASLSQQLDSIGGKAVEQAERFTFLAGAILTPITLGFKDFADKNAEVRERINALAEEIKNVPPLNFAKREAIEEEIKRLSSIEMQTRAAAAANNKLSFAFNAIRFEITKTIAEAILPYTRTIIGYVKTAIAWIQTNRQLLVQFVEIAAKAGLVFAALAPILAIGGKLIRVFALLVSPAGLVAGAVFLVYKAFNLLIGTEVIASLISKLTELWNQFRSGLITVEEFAIKLVQLLVAAFKNASVTLVDRVQEYLGDDFVNKILNQGIFAALRDNERISQFASELIRFFKAAFKEAGKQIDFESLGQGFFDTLFGETIGGAVTFPLRVTSAGLGAAATKAGQIGDAAFNAFAPGDPGMYADLIGKGDIIINVQGDVNDGQSILDKIAEGARRAARDRNR